MPLPHPSGASQWFNVPENKVPLARALEILAELRVALLTKDELLPHRQVRGNQGRTIPLIFVIRPSSFVTIYYKDKEQSRGYSSQAR